MIGGVAGDNLVAAHPAQRPWARTGWVVGWRFEVLLGLGFPLVEAELFAESQVDLHRAADLLRRGCPPALAARIRL